MYVRQMAFGGCYLDVGVGPGEGYAHPEADEDAEQLDDIGVRHRIEAAEQRVEHRHARAEDHRGAVVHVDDHRQRRTCDNLPSELRPARTMSTPTGVLYVSTEPQFADGTVKSTSDYTL
jgi:hypothetical protein